MNPKQAGIRVSEFAAPGAYGRGTSDTCPKCGHEDPKNIIAAESGYGMTYYGQCRQCGAKWHWDSRAAFNG